MHTMATRSSRSRPPLQQQRLAVLLPITSRGCSSSGSARGVDDLIGGLQRLAASLASPGQDDAQAGGDDHDRTDANGPRGCRGDPARVCVTIGLDEDDRALRSREAELRSAFESEGVGDVRVEVFLQAGRGEGVSQAAVALLFTQELTCNRQGHLHRMARNVM